MLPLLLTVAAWLDDIDKKIDEVFKGRTDRIVGELTDEVLREVGHTRRLRAARAPALWKPEPPPRRRRRRKS